MPRTHTHTHIHTDRDIHRYTDTEEIYTRKRKILFTTQLYIKDMNEKKEREREKREGMTTS